MTTDVKRLPARGYLGALPETTISDESSVIGSATTLTALPFMPCVRSVQLRGHLDRLAGGTGLRRGRRDPGDVAVGDAIDFWRVVEAEPGRRLALLAEMKVPGSATLEFELQPEGARRTRIEVTAYFHPAGAPGLVYWHALGLAHVVIFNGLAREIARRAERASVSS